MHTTLDEAAAALTREWEAAWNTHDMARMAPLVTEDADWVTVGGARLQGRAQVESVHAALHAGQLKASRWSNRSHTVQALGPQAALLHLTWSVQGDLDADGTPRQPRNGIFTWLLAGQPGGRWRIRAAHATNVAVP
jgi:uncharacterized protein (TIGR02246 family)